LIRIAYGAATPVTQSNVLMWPVRVGDGRPTTVENSLHSKTRDSTGEGNRAWLLTIFVVVQSNETF